MSTADTVDQGAMQYATIDDLTNADRVLPEEDVTIPGVGVVRVRSLTRAESLKSTMHDWPHDQLEQFLLSCAMVRPTMSEAAVRRWQERAPAGEIGPIARKITELSGLKETAAKEAYQQFRDAPAD